MRSWVGLFKKDFKLTRTAFFIGLVINFLILLFAIYVGTKLDDKLLSFIPLIAAIVFHVLYFPIILFMGLKIESNQLHLWMHNPQPATSLLLSKLVNGLIMMATSLIMLYVMSGLLLIPKFSLIEAYWTDVWVAGLLIFIHIIFISLFIGIWILFLWTLYQFFKSKIGRWSWLVVIGAVIIPGWLTAQIESTKLYLFLTQWGSITYKFPTFPMEIIQAYTGEYFYNIMILVGLFYLSSWIIDKKVEV